MVPQTKHASSGSEPATGKFDAKDFRIGRSMTAVGLGAKVSLMRLGENIPATLPTYATIAPILHARTHVTPTQRGTTPSKGAADADGR
jgi:hypothetical protein